MPEIKKRIIITNFYPMRKMENYNCASLCIAAVTRNLYLPELNPFNFEVGIFGIDFYYDRGKLAGIDKILDYPLRAWKEFTKFFPISKKERMAEFLESNLGVKYIKHKVETCENMLLQLEKKLADGSPAIVFCNPYHLRYSEYYQKVSGGALNSYHSIVIYGISRADKKIWIYDPTLNNYQGFILLDDFYQAVEDGRGIDNFEGPIYYHLEYNGKEFHDMNRELLMGSLDLYLNNKNTRIKTKLLNFFSDYINYYNQFPSLYYKKKLLEFGFYIFRELTFRRSHWYDFLEYYKLREDGMNIGEEIAALKVQIDKLFALSNTLYANSLKEKKNLCIDPLMNTLEQAMNNEEAVFTGIYEKLKKG